MTGWPEHAHRAAEHRQPRPTSHWSKGEKAVLHDGPVRDDCPECIAERETGQ